MRKGTGASATIELQGTDEFAGVRFTPKEIPPAVLTVAPGPERPISDVMRDCERVARAVYAPQEMLRFHNWSGHIGEMDKVATILCNRCEQYGVSVDRDALKVAMWLHDTMIGVREGIFGMTCKEQLSSFYAYNVLRQLGAPETFARKVEGIINATHVDVIPETIEQKLIRAVDISNIGGPYSAFFPNTMRLYEEARNVSGSELSFEQFTNGALRFLGGYLAPMLQITPEAVDESGRSVWHTQAISNVANLHRESRTVPGQARVIAELGLDSAHSSVLRSRGLKSNELFVGVASEDMARDALEVARVLQQRWDSLVPIFFVPGSPGTSPLVDGLCDEVYIKLTAELGECREAARVAAPKSVVHLFVPHDKMDSLCELASIELLENAEFQVASQQPVGTGKRIRFERESETSRNSA